MVEEKIEGKREKPKSEESKLAQDLQRARQFLLNPKNREGVRRQLAKELGLSEDELKKLPGEIQEEARLFSIMVRYIEEDLRPSDSDLESGTLLWEDFEKGGDKSQTLKKLVAYMDKIERVTPKKAGQSKTLATTPKVEANLKGFGELNKMVLRLSDINIKINEVLDTEPLLNEDDKKFLKGAMDKIQMIVDFSKEKGTKDKSKLPEDVLKFWKEQIVNYNTFKRGRLYNLLHTKEEKEDKKDLGVEAISTEIPPTDPNIITYLNGDWENLGQVIKENSIRTATEDVLSFYEKMHGEHALTQEERKLLQRTRDVLFRMSIGNYNPQDEEFWNQIDKGERNVRELLQKKLTERDSMLAEEEKALKELNEMGTTPDKVKEAKELIIEKLNDEEISWSDEERGYLERIKRSFHFIENALSNKPGANLIERNLTDWKQYLDGKGAARLIREKIEGQESEKEGNSKLSKELIAKYGIPMLSRIRQEIKGTPPKHLLENDNFTEWRPYWISALDKLVSDPESESFKSFSKEDYDNLKPLLEHIQLEDKKEIGEEINIEDDTKEPKKEPGPRTPDIVPPQERLQKNIDKLNTIRVNYKNPKAVEFIDKSIIILSELNISYESKKYFNYEDSDNIAFFAKYFGGHQKDFYKEIDEIEKGKKEPPKIEDESKISDEDRKLIERSLKQLGIEEKDFRNIEGFEKIKNDPGRQLDVLNSIQNMKMQYILEEAEKRHLAFMNEKGVGRLARLKRNIFKESNFAKHRKEVGLEKIDFSLFGNEVSKMIDISLAGPEIKIEYHSSKEKSDRGYDLIGQYVSEKMTRELNIDPKFANRFNRIASNFANQPTKHDAEAKDFPSNLKKQRKNAEQQYESCLDELLYHIAKERGMSYYLERKPGDDELIVNPEVLGMLERNIIEAQVENHQLNIMHPEVENELRSYRENDKLFGIGAEAFLIGATTRLAMSGGRRVANLVATMGLGAPPALAITAGVGAVFGFGTGAFKGWKGASKEILKREMEVRKGKKDQRGERSNIDKHFVKVEDLQKKMDKVKNFLDNAKSDEERAKYVQDLKTRIFYTQKKLKEEAIVFGNLNDSLINRYNLMKTLSEAQTLALINDIPWDKKRAKEGVGLTKLSRLDKFMRYNTIRREKDRKIYGAKKAAEGAFTGAVTGAGMAVLGGAAIHLGGEYLGGYIDRLTKYAALYGHVPAEDLAIHTYDHLVDSANHLNMHNNIVDLNSQTTSEIDNMHDKVTQNFNEIMSKIGTSDIRAPDSISVPQHGFTLENEGQSREYAIARILKDKYISQDPNMDHAEALKIAKREAYKIINDPKLNYDLGDEARGIHHAPNDREWRDYKVVHKGDTIYLDEENKRVRIVPRGHTASEYFKVESPPPSPSHDTVASNIPTANVVEASGPVSSTPQEVLKIKEEEIVETLKNYSNYYNYTGGRDPRSIDSWARSLQRLITSDPTIKELILDPYNAPVIEPQGKSFHIQILHRDSLDTPWEEVKNVVYEKNVMPFELTAEGKVSPTNLYGKPIDWLGARGGPVVETPNLNSLSPDAIRDMAGAFDLDPTTVENLSEITVRKDINLIDHFRDIFSSDSHLKSLNSEERSRGLYKFFKHLISQKKDVLESAGISKGNFWGLSPGDTFDSTKIIDKSFFEDSFHNLSSINGEEAARAKIFNENTTEIFEKLRGLSQTRTIGVSDLVRIIDEKRYDVLRNAVGK